MKIIISPDMGLNHFPPGEASYLLLYIIYRLLGCYPLGVMFNGEIRRATMETSGCDERVLKKMIDLYVSCREKYILCLPNGHIIMPKKKDGKYCWLSDNIMRNHLAQKYAIGVFADGYGSKFICFDVDDGNPSTVHAIISALKALGFAENDIHVSYSGNKGYHVEMFFDGILLTKRLCDLYDHVIAECRLDPHKVEFRPMSKAAIKLPLSRHAKTGNMCWFVDRRTLLPIMRAEYILGIQQIKADEAKALIPAAVESTSEAREKPTSGKGASSPETRNLGTTLEEEGTRHNMMRNIAVYNRTHGASREECEKILAEWILEQNPLLYHSSHREVQRDIDELIAWVYSDRFVVQKASTINSTVIRTSMMKSVLEQGNRTARRLCFLLLARCRLQQPRISEKDAGRAIGVSPTTVCKAIRHLAAKEDIRITEGKRFKLPDGTFSSESRSYYVPHSSGYKDELCVTITMRELISDFNACYHKALHS